MESNQVLLKLGRFKKWQITNYLMFCFSVMFPPAWHFLSTVYIAFKPEHHCTVPDNVPLNQSIPMEDGKLSSCLMYKHFSVNNDTIPCNNGWTYLGDHGPTIVTKWDLVCDRGHLAQLPQTFFVVGAIIGALIFSFLSDKLGRKPIFLFCQWSTSVVGTITAFMPDYIGFCIIKFIMGTLSYSILTVGFILTCESFPAPHRTFVGTIIENFWALACCTLPLLAYLFKNWVHVQLFISLVGLLTIPLYWFLPESVLWLEISGRTDKAEKILQRAGRMNKVDLPNPIFHPSEKAKDGSAMIVKKSKSFSLEGKLHLLNNLFHKESKKEEESDHIYTLKDLFGNRTLRKLLILVSLLWFTVVMGFYAFSLTTAQLAGNHYLNGFLGGIIEIPAYLASYFIMLKVGRRYMFMGFQVTTGICLIMQVVVGKIDFGSHVNNVVLVVVFNMIGKFGIAGALGSLDLYTPELFPTTLRNQAQGIACVAGKLGTIVSTFLPFILEKNDWVPLIVLALLLFFACAFVYFLPETIHRDLPHTIEDIESWTVVVPQAMDDNDVVLFT